MTKVKDCGYAMAEIKKLFDADEHHVKEVEVFRGEIAVPAINELKYVGHHLLNRFRNGTTRKAARPVGKQSRAGIGRRRGQAAQRDTRFTTLALPDTTAGFARLNESVPHAPDTGYTLAGDPQEHARYWFPMQ